MSGGVTGVYREHGTVDFVTQPGALVQAKTIKDSPGRGFSIDVVNTSAGDRYVYIFDATSDSGNVIFPPFHVPSKGLVSVEQLGPVVFQAGLTIASSSTQPTYTAAGADFMMKVVYK